MTFALEIAITLVLAWVLFITVLAVIRPRGMSLREAREIVPDTVRLLRALSRDPQIPKGSRRWLAALLVYLALPIDIVPDFIPVVGYVDDVIVVAFVLRRVVHRAGPSAVNRHWVGSPAGLEVVRRLAGLDAM